MNPKHPHCCGPSWVLPTPVLASRALRLRGRLAASLFGFRTAHPALLTSRVFDFLVFMLSLFSRSDFSFINPFLDLVCTAVYLLSFFF